MTRAHLFSAPPQAQCYAWLMGGAQESKNEQGKSEQCRRMLSLGEEKGTRAPTFFELLLCSKVLFSWFLISGDWGC